MRCDPFFCPVCVCLCICIVSVWFEGGVGQLALRQCLCWWREKGPAGSCVSAACMWETLPGGSASLADVQKTPQPPFTPPFPSWSIFLFCLWAQGTQRPFKTATYGAVVIKATVLPLCLLCLLCYNNGAIGVKSTRYILGFLLLHHNCLHCWSVYFCCLSCGYDKGCLFTLSEETPATQSYADVAWFWLDQSRVILQFLK